MIKSANMGKIMNNRAFDHKRIAEGYAKRPWLHKSVMEQLKKDCNLNLDFTFKNGLDVGCDAGLSIRALKLICDNDIDWETGSYLWRKETDMISVLRMCSVGN